MTEEIEIKAAFKAKVNELLTAHPNQWTGEDSAEVVRDVLKLVKDKDGNAIKLTTEENDVVTLASRPTADVQIRVIRTIVEKHNASLDKVTEDLVRRVVGPGPFKIELTKAGRIKDTKVKELSDLLD